MPATSSKRISIDPASFKTLGDLMRYLRESAHLTQRELASKVDYHYSYISRVEKNLHVPEAATLMARFVPALGLENEPEWSARLLELAKTAAGIKAESSFRLGVALSQDNAGKLPASLTSMLGREREVASLIEILQRAEVRLVTIVGPPGVGKTCLALHVAEQVAKAFADGVIFVDLTPVKQAGLVLSAMAASLGIQELAEFPLIEKLKAALHKRDMLVVMDNFEQVLEAAPQLIPLLGDAPGIKILATSREALRVGGEQEFPLAPLPVPLTLSGNSFLDSPAVQLFIERARAVKPDFKIQGQTASRVAEICRRLDGLPLAIELAAARVGTLSLSAMLDQFARRFEWLTRGDRHLPIWRQTLWGAVEWSYNLLTGQERALLNRLSAFAGGWTLEAAESVCSDDILCAPSDILGLLMQLADKSLVVADAEGERYYFLETLREFAHEKLKESADLGRVRQRHCEYYLKFIESAQPHLLQGGEQVRWLNQVEHEHNNLREALAWATETPTRAATALKLGWAIHTYWSARSYVSEARHWLNQILALDSAPSAMRSDLLRYASDYASTQGDYNSARVFEEEGMTISKTLGDEAGVYYSMEGLAMLAGMQGDYGRAAKLLEQVLVYRRQTNDTLRLTPTLNNLAIATRRMGNLERAKQLYAEAIAVTKSIGNPKSLAHALSGLAEVHTELKEYVPAIRLQRESISLRHQLGDLKGLAFSFDALAISLDYLGESLLATQLASTSNKIFNELGIVIPLATRVENENFITQLHAKLGDGAFEKAWSSGQSMSPEQAVALTEDTQQL